MSRIGKLPVAIPAGIKVAVNGQTIAAEGPKGKLEFACHPAIRMAVEDGQVVVTRSAESRENRALHGLTRAIVANMVEGVQKGYEKKLELQGVGYVCTLAGNKLSLRVGFANQVVKTVPPGLTVTCPDQTHINISGCDKQLVGEFAAAIRAVRKPEPYKGKGVRYLGEQIKLKAGKAAKA